MLSPDDSRFRAVQAMTQWVSAIADNIRNPLAGMAAALEIVSRELALRLETGHCNEDLINDACQRIRRRFVSLNEYISELVDFGRPPTLSPQIINLGEWLESLVQEVGTSHPLDDSNPSILSLCGGQLGFLAGEGILGAQVAWDAQRMAIAVRTLITNGIEAAIGQGIPRVQVFAEKMGSEFYAYYAIHVDDNGPGFDSRLGDSVFEPFFSTKEAGTGLGMAIARKYAEAHGGTISLGRAPLLGGARVTILMPGVVNGSFSMKSQ